MVADSARTSDLLRNFALTAHPRRFTPCSGFNLGKLVSFYECRKQIESEPTRCLFVSLPGFGTEAGCRHNNKTMNHLTQLILLHLKDPEHHVIIDGAVGNPAWDQPEFRELVENTRFQKPLTYFWCAAGVKYDGRPFRRRSRVWATCPLPKLRDWNNCCGKSFDDHSTARNSKEWSQCKASERRFPAEVLGGFLQGIAGRLPEKVVTFTVDDRESESSEHRDTIVGQHATKVGSIDCSENTVNVENKSVDCVDEVVRDSDKVDASKRELRFYGSTDHIRHDDQIDVDYDQKLITHKPQESDFRTNQNRRMVPLQEIVIQRMPQRLGMNQLFL